MSRHEVLDSLKVKLLEADNIYASSGVTSTPNIWRALDDNPQLIPSGAVTTLGLTETVNTNTAIFSFNAVTDTLTVLKTGWYEASLNVTANETIGAIGFMDVYLIDNLAVQFATCSYAFEDVAGGLFARSISSEPVYVYLLANATIRLQATHALGNNANTSLRSVSVKYLGV